MGAVCPPPASISPSTSRPGPYLAAADGALLVVVGCPAGAVRPVLPLEEAGVGVLLQLLQVAGLGALGELGLPRDPPSGQAGPPCVAPVGDVHLEGGKGQEGWHCRGTTLPVPVPGCPPWSGVAEEAPATTVLAIRGCWGHAVVSPPSSALPAPLWAALPSRAPRAAVGRCRGALPRWGPTRPRSSPWGWALVLTCRKAVPWARCRRRSASRSFTTP